MIGSQFLVGEPFNQVENQSLNVLPTSLWIQTVRTADILILNHGHHWHRRDENFGLYRAMATNVMRALKQEFKGTHVVFRTSNWGHYGCHHIKHPLTSISNNLAHDPYSWMQPIYSDYIWGDVANELGLGPFFQFNNASLTLLRGDAHVDQQHTLSGVPFIDCLHNCVPGAPDYWNWLLYNSIMSFRLPEYDLND